MKNKALRVYIDGASRGNPGHSGIGVVVCDENDKVLEEYFEYIGIGTNNQAEYKAFLIALDKLKKHDATDIKIYLDSEILFKQITGEYRVRDEKLKELFSRALKLSRLFKKITYEWIPREKNKHADKLSQKAINLNV